MRGRPLFDQARHERLDPAHDTEQVHLEHPAPVRVAHRLERAAHEHTRVVAQEMAAAEARPRGVGERVEIGAARDVAVRRERLAALLDDPLGDALGRIELDVGGDHAHPGGRRRTRDPLADPASGAGNDCYPITELLHPPSSRVVYLRRLAPPSHCDAPTPRTPRWPMTS